MDTLATLLLSRRRRLHLPPGDATGDDGFVDSLEVDLAERGWVLDAAAREAFASLRGPLRTAWADWLLATLDAETGADRPHVPLFRRFPDTTPENTAALYVERVLAFLAQEPGQPCVLCAAEDRVAPVSPCGHLVCRTCFDGSDYSACPICHRRIDPDDPFLAVTAPGWRPPPSAPLRFRRVVGRTHRDADAAELRDALVTRAAPLSEGDRADLALLVAATTAPGDLGWLPGDVPVRETLAYVLSLALRGDPAVALDAVAARWTNATDVARTLWSLAGGDPGLVLPAKPVEGHASERWRPAIEPAVFTPVARVGPLSRPLRRAALAAYETFDLRNAVEDVLRHPAVWKRLGERLHPFERADRYPAAAVCFAVLRGTPYAAGSAVGRAILAAGEKGTVRAVVTGDGVVARARTFASRVEAYLADGDTGSATRLLSTRPGELLRRLDHLARLTPPEGHAALAALAGKAAEDAAAAVALAAYAALSARDEPPPAAAMPSAVAEGQAAVEAAAESRLDGLRARRDPAEGPEKGRDAGREAGTPRRVFFPRGSVMRSWSAPDRRPLLPPGTPDAFRAALADALVRRAAGLPRFDVAVVDAALAEYPAPSRSRTVAPASTTLPRGARVAIPPGETVRLFLHWTDPEGTRVDLDLSVLLLDDAWRYVAHCDYTQLRFGHSAVHSGDLTSAPAPLGATEFLDLRLPTLVAAGVTYAVPVVFSYNDVPFGDLDDAFAGFSLPVAGGAQFDPARVALRFDLTTEAKVLVPMVVHLVDRTLRWTDLNVTAFGYGHGIRRYADTLRRVGEDMELAFGTSRRATLLDVAAAHAAGRAARVWVRYADGSAREVPASFASVVSASGLGSGDEALPPLDGAVLFVAADRLPADVESAGEGSVLVTATSGDPAANADPFDLVTAL
ncbi:MAG TPA: MXAN_6230/SCO0854 family RING domain-containing protein [Frankiaceae bacterium]|nr:MXAN_6230/SCO0854 family RING domain-containing protein [Frankiaceae bacterium]